MNFNDTLRAYNHGVLRGAQTRLAKAVGVAPNTVSQWVGGLLPGEAIRPKVAKELGVSVAQLVGMFHEEKDGASMVRDISTACQEWANLPIMGIVPAGKPNEAIDAFQGNYPVPRHMVSGNAEDYFIIRAKGDSMIELNIADGDMLAIHRQSTAENGDVVIAAAEGDGVACKRLRIKNGKRILETGNPEPPPLRERPFEIIGKVLWRGGKPG